MFKITSKQTFNDNLYVLEFDMPAIAQRGEPGHYVDIRLNPDTPPITLPIANRDRERGTFTVVNRAVDLPSEQLMLLSEGDEVFQIRGPLGGSCSFSGEGKVVLVAEGLGVASLLARAREYRSAGHYTICVIGFDTREHLFWETEFFAVCDELYVTTIDGTYGVSGKVTGPLKAICETQKDVELVVMISDLKNMKRGAKIAANAGIPVLVNFDAIRTPAGAASVFDVPDSSQTAFEFVRAPELKAEDVDFDKLIARQREIAHTTDNGSVTT